MKVNAPNRWIFNNINLYIIPIHNILSTNNASTKFYITAHKTSVVRFQWILKSYEIRPSDGIKKKKKILLLFFFFFEYLQQWVLIKFDKLLKTRISIYGHGLAVKCRVRPEYFKWKLISSGARAILEWRAGLLKPKHERLGMGARRLIVPLVSEWSDDGV